jgi:hypothetical protein
MLIEPDVGGSRSGVQLNGLPAESTVTTTRLGALSGSERHIARRLSSTQASGENSSG